MKDIPLDQERQKQAKDLGRLKRKLFLIGLLLAGAYALAWLAFGWAASLRGWLAGFTANPWLLVAAFGGLYAAGDFLLGLPLAYLQGYLLPRRYDLSTQTRAGWATDQLKSLAIGLVFAGIVLEGIYALLRAYPEAWWLWASGLALIFMMLATNLEPVLIAPLFNKYVPLGTEHADLELRLICLAERAGSRVRGVFKVDMSRRTKAANAGLSGLGNTRRIVLGDTLIAEFTAEEIETVLAHELGHHVHRDIPLFIAVSSFLALAGFYLASLGLRWGAAVFGFNGPGDIATLPIFLLVMGLFFLVSLPLWNGFSRWRERLADRFAVEVTGNGDAFASALTRLANQNLAEVDPEPWVEWLLLSHPAVRKRIAAARSHGVPIPAGEDFA